MKSREFNKKLMLNKKTIAHLENNQMKKVPGGAPPSVKVCPVTWGEGSCPTRCETIPGQYPCPGWDCSFLECW